MASYVCIKCGETKLQDFNSQCPYCRHTPTGKIELEASKLLSNDFFVKEYLDEITCDIKSGDLKLGWQKVLKKKYKRKIRNTIIATPCVISFFLSLFSIKIDFTVTFFLMFGLVYIFAFNMFFIETAVDKIFDKIIDIHLKKFSDIKH